MSSTDRQEVVVGRQFKRPLQVYVTTMEGVPVKGARVAFRALNSSRPTFIDASTGALGEGMAAVTVLTDGRGMAEVIASPDTTIGRSAILRAGGRYEQLVGWNQITAETERSDGNTVILAEPFTGLGLPDVPSEVRLLAQKDWMAPAQMILGQDLPATVVDRWGNLLANQVVTWTQSPATGAFIEPKDRPRDRVALLDLADPAQKSPSLEQITDTQGTVVMNYINGGATHQVSAAVSGVPPAAYVVSSYDSETLKYVFGYVPNARESWDGIYGTLFPEPFVFQIMRRGQTGEPPWVSINAGDGTYSLVAVTMGVSDGVTSIPIPAAGATATPVPGDNGLLAATIWPRYAVKDGTQNLLFSADVLRADGTKECCQSTFAFAMRSLTVPIGFSRVLPGALEVPLSDSSPSIPGDLGVLAAIENRGSYPLYASDHRVPERYRRATRGGAWTGRCASSRRSPRSHWHPIFRDVTFDPDETPRHARRKGSCECLLRRKKRPRAGAGSHGRSAHVSRQARL